MSFILLMVNKLVEFISGVLTTYFLCDNDIRTFVTALIQTIKNWFVSFYDMNLELSFCSIFFNNKVKICFSLLNFIILMLNNF